MKNIVSGENLRVFEGETSEDEKGRYFVRFYDSKKECYCYVNDGDVIEWEEWKDMNCKTIQRTISSKSNSRKYYVTYCLHRNSQPTSNGDIDHFYVLDNGDIIGVTLIDYVYYKVTEQEFFYEAFL